MPLFAKSDEAERCFKEAKRLIETSNEEDNIDRAIHLLEEAVMLKPYEKKYRKKLEEVNQLKSKLREKFLMQVEDVFWIEGEGVVATGKVQQGVIHPGAEVRIVGLRNEKRDTVASLEMFYKSRTRAIPGEAVGLLFKNLGEGDVQPGDTIEKVEA